MTVSCWRLLAAFLLIFVVTVFSPGQDAVADRTPALVSGSTAAQHPELTDAGQVPEIPHAPLRYPPIPVRIALPQIVRTSGIIFSGRVTFVGRTSKRSLQSSDTGTASRRLHSRWSTEFVAH